MTDNILCLNCGSSSLKFSIYAMRDDRAAVLGHGSVEKIGLEGGRLAIRDEAGASLIESSDNSRDHEEALNRLLDVLPQDSASEIIAVGHRVVHGGPDRSGPATIDSELLDELRGRVPLAPLHLPHEIRVIEATAARWPTRPQVACFDTAFHRDMPETAQRFPLPRHFFDEGLLRYGYHGLSYQFVREALGADVSGRVIIAHLGNGSSLAALRDGRPIATTMGFTPTGGVMMGTRSGDLDPGVLLYLLQHEEWDGRRLDRLVNQEAGLLGVSGLSSDMQSLLELRAVDSDADQAVTMYCRSIRMAVGALATELGGLDLLVFTGGIGERAATLRREICRGLEHLGLIPGDEDEARGPHGLRRSVRVIPTNENLVIAQQTWNLLFSESS